MSEQRALSIHIGVTAERRFIWTIQDGDVVRIKDALSYATRREATAAANKALQNLTRSKPK